MNKKKIIIISAIAILLVVACVVTCFLLLGDKKTDALATVNGEGITAEDFAMYQLAIEGSMLQQAQIPSSQAEEFFTTTEIEGKSAGDLAKEMAMEQAILSTVLSQKAKEMGITLTDEDKALVDQQITAEINGLGGRDKFDKRLKDIGTNMDALKKFMETDLLVGKYHEVLYSMPEYSVTKEQAKEYVNTTYVKTKHILLLTVDEANQPLSDEEKAAVKAQIDNLYQQIMNGADFDALMNEYSQDPGLAASPEGYVFNKGQMVPEFETTSYALQIGEASEPVETTYGYHIIKREVITDADLEAYADVEWQNLQAEKLNIAYEQCKSAANIQINQEELAKISLVSLRVMGN